MELPLPMQPSTANQVKEAIARSVRQRALLVALTLLSLDVCLACTCPSIDTKANLIMTQSKLICCKIYISESCNASATAEIDREARSDPSKVVVLTKFGDRIYNRVRYTLVSYVSKNVSEDKSTLEIYSPIRNVLLKMVRAAFSNLDIEKHSGGHPRMGVIDDTSFHPLGEAEKEDAAFLANQVAFDIGNKFEVPVFLYGAAHEDQKTLGDI